MPNIYLLQDSGDAVELSEQPYDFDEILQRLLAEHPNVLGRRSDRGRAAPALAVCGPRSWHPVRGGADRWSLDHLFVDQDGTPTLVEVKRSSDTRIRREVVGQMRLPRRTPASVTRDLRSIWRWTSRGSRLKHVVQR